MSETLDNVTPGTFGLTLRLAGPMMAGLLLVMGLLSAWELYSRESHMEQELLNSARAYHNQILLTRMWNASHGGVYVRVDGRTRPNPYLDVPGRDLTTSEGVALTLVNPAYMTRQISEFAGREGRYKFHITSLRPINPANAADAWEARALGEFASDAGVAERHGFEGEGEAEMFRYMAPLVVDEDCLGCHARHGYDVGDIRGGLSVSIPTASLRAIGKRSGAFTLVSFALVGALCSGAIFWTTRRYVRGTLEAMGREVEARRLEAAVHVAGGAAHELRQPLTIIIGVAELIPDRLAAGHDVREELEILKSQCFRMDRIISRMLRLNTYRTRSYTGETEIFDLTGDDDGSGEGR